MFALQQLLMLKHIYKGKSTYFGDIIFTWDGKYLYKGKSTYFGI